MLRRVLLTVLIFCLALPAAVPAAAFAQAPAAVAAAAFAQAPAPMAMAQHLHHSEQPASDHDQGQHGSKHQCIGCAVALDRSPVAENRLMVAAVLTRTPLADGMPEARAGPATPPPRF